ncbi:intercellular adhesion molecule 1 isoform X2 [Huso huso]|uniref:Intercellular adhesion molecule 1 isoform X2 n=1 Tax=Huso huso TaxID=61971 RepID=A0ABR0Y8T7_HUSHU
MEFGSLMRDMFLGLLCFAVTGAASAVCDVNIDHSGVVVRFGDPVTVNCSTTREDVLGAGWESSVSPVNEPNSTTAFWNASSLTVRDAKPKCLMNFNNETELPECIFLFAPEFMKIDNGSNIKCLVLGVASAQYLAVQFYKGDDQIAGSDNVTHNGTQFPVNATITFPKNHGVNYTCTAELDFGPEAPIQNTSPPYATSTIGPGEEKLNMSSLPYTMSPKAAASPLCDVNIDPSRVVVRFGDPVTVTCSTTREDVLATGWESSVSPVNEPNSKIAVWNVSSLTVWDAEPECFINYMNEPRQCVEKLDLVIYKYPESVSLIAPEFMKIGVESNITCQVLDVAPIRYLSVKLYKGDEQLGNRSFTHNSTRFPVNESVPFPVTPTRADNGAEYTCVAELQLGPGEPIKNASLPFRMLPIDFEEQPNLTVSENVEVNKSSTVRCELKNAFPPEEVQVELLINNEIHTIRSNMDNVYVEERFTLDSVEPAVITCNVSLRSLSKSASRNVQGYVLPEPTLHTEAVLVNQTGIVTCSVDGSFPATATQRLLLNGFIVNETHNSTPAQYEFKAEKELNGKMITCETELNLAATSVKKNQITTFNVLYKPSLLSADEENVEVREGGSIVLNCSADGNPAPTYEWKYPKADNVQEITKDGVSTVNITRASSSNSGFYTCHAKNRYGDKMMNITVAVKDQVIITGGNCF